MIIVRRLLTALIVVLTVATQSAVIAGWNLPGATPDLVLVVVAAFAMKQHATRATIIGFGAGLLLDATPPSVTLLGSSAFTLAIVGFLAAQLRTDLTRSPFGPLAFIAAAGAGSIIIHAALGGLLGDPTISLLQTPIAAISNAFYCAILAMVVVPLIRVMLTYLMPAPTQYLRR